MDLKDIASVSGKSGLYKVVKPTRTGVILETIDAQKTRIIANTNNRVSLLKEISIYTNGKESSVALESVFQQIYDKLGPEIPVSGKSGNQELQSFLTSIIPNYDTEKVYVSDIKKLVSWYTVIAQNFPEKFTAQKETAESKTEASENSKEDSTKPVKSKKTTAKAGSEPVLETPAKEKETPKAKAKSAVKK